MLPDVLAYRSRLPAPLIPAKMIDAAMVNGPWKRLVPAPAHQDGTVNRHALRAPGLMPVRSAARGWSGRPRYRPGRSS